MHHTGEMAGVGGWGHFLPQEYARFSGHVALLTLTAQYFRYFCLSLM